MPFSPTFEKQVNSDMREKDNPDQYAQESKGERISTPPFEAEAEDADMSEKKDRPPRFSTLFGAASAPPAREFESYPAPSRKSGIWMPTPLFVLFAVILLFESTLLFAYTTIGLYNNLPSGFIPATAPAINIAPNFIMPQAQATITQTTTMTVLGNGLLSSIAIPTTTSISSTAEAASNLFGMLEGIGTPPSSTKGSSSATHTPGVATSTMILSQIPAPQQTVNSVKLVTVDASGSTLPARPTVTATTVIDPSQAAAASSANAASKLSIKTVMAGLAAALTPHAIASSTTFATSAASTTAPAPAVTALSTSMKALNDSHRALRWLAILSAPSTNSTKQGLGHNIGG
ncbi:hypothetical protein LTR91_024476 [Friedmanniomyces endolithicus]|uniref:Uncharacterized protein n=1 Tax=Friedmanniomyces endolithicus TaxID=329885 RepID=A0AAN6F6H0_9PEZI|nr:hypothetical protein LTS00_012965 [Friedmanniomyces endolithicus]KAK0304798.1 hypothetical protein LTR82_017053 [Friedmanniomyces endolithicus]KAK0307171.1 hypothetical protein LTR01_005817 [Friedmanniomyces endolithicus]KAK0833909.1 hypothetical protein LTR73_001672 [Friedmanniomyces endolithicus]KAK0952318.1 hypothetical protein LTR91_024476 [Friedmanniomyces endolithicus]